ncbi:dihydropteroate synthase [Sodaliphilus sp.]|uniref:dihydropteroate synthase n=1 Tax=Sodaliphilus sp. TaxID=2815818 RepID=UPI00388DBC98
MRKFTPFTLSLRGRELKCDRPLVMGILNVTPDSFYAGCRATDEEAISMRVKEIVEQGADVIDIGAYSTRPGAADVTAAEEVARLRRAVEVVKREAPGMATSVDTFRTHVARVAVEELGVDMVNDVSGGSLDDAMFETVASLQVPYVLMHMRGTPATMQQLTDYDNVTCDVVEWLGARIEQLRALGAKDIIVDPGFGFSKTLDQNYELLAGLERFRELGVPLLVGVSRKSMIYKKLGVDPARALNGTTAVNTIALMAGAHIIRVHDVREAVEAREIVCATQRYAIK